MTAYAVRVILYKFSDAYMHIRIQMNITDIQPQLVKYSMYVTFYE